jgi:hypothetical protein
MKNLKCNLKVQLVNALLENNSLLSLNYITQTTNSGYVSNSVINKLMSKPLYTYTFLKSPMYLTCFTFSDKDTSLKNINLLNKNNILLKSYSLIFTQSTFFFNLLSLKKRLNLLNSIKVSGCNLFMLLKKSYIFNV